ncbi:deoxyribonuclease TatD (DNase tatD) [Treponema primitia ZAS-2]|uniref:Deoxyribonuclease TatD (DNase tatD) n=1 Tax=Treponema primitia (strain ATCC BAA-887 / DSM 12427 / ZAS-2) TaxID=545694 RepID=F5YQD5_TREPZ|nr:TatD family hydrolase [Treponema primitia]AEF83525.1 deoxyribonuclease TatD (DNase tatD) [Treponema primitia ZAS-2]
MRIIDIGVNLMNAAFDRDRDAVTAAAEAAGVGPLVITGSNTESSAAAAVYAEKHRGKCYATAGVHPHNARFWEESAGKIRSLTAGKGAVDKVIVAVGECGLDYNRDFSPRDKQRRCFEDQIQLAVELGMPLFLHERDAFEDFSALIRKYRKDIPRLVVHCFTGGERELEAYLELGAYIGMTCWLCDERRGAHLVPLLKKIPPDKLMFETDAPYLTPGNLPPTVKPDEKPGRKRNKPEYLVHVVKFAAQVLGKDTEILAKETFDNTVWVFNL